MKSRLGYKKLSKRDSEPIVLVCKKCGAERTVRRDNLYKIKSGRHSGLCKSCGARSRGKHSVAARDKTSYICPSCGEKRIITGDNLWRIEKGEISGQCRSCAFKGIPHLNARGAKNYNWNGGTEARVCEWCGEEFAIAPSWIKKGGGHFCSITCRGKAKTGKNNPVWQGGTSFEPYPLAFNGALKKMIRDRDDHACALCGEHGKDVHHIDYDKENCQLNNLITLCRACHGKTNGSRTGYAAILSDKASDMSFAGFAYY